MKQAFTLVELLAVIVILAIILVIAVPQIMDTIESSKKSSLESSTKLVASTLETDYQSSLVAGTTFATSGSCASYVDSNEYSACTYTISDSGEATVTLTGKDNSKLNGLKASGTKNNASIVTEQSLPSVKANFAAYTWNEIQTLAKAASEGDLTYDELTSTYNLAVGQTRCINLNGFTTMNDNGCGEEGRKHSGFSVRIANMSTPNECLTTGFSQSACGFVIEFVDIIKTYHINLSATNVGGWSSSKIREYLNGVVDSSTKVITYSNTVGSNEEGILYNAIKAETGDIIIDTKVVSGYGSSEEANYTTSDKIYLLSAHEVWTDGSSSKVSTYDSAYNFTRQLDYYKNLGVTTSSNRNEAIKQCDYDADEWWLRTSYLNTNMDFIFVSSGGKYIGSNYANLYYGISPAFRIG